MNTANTVSNIATALFVLVTLPPAEKFDQGRGYYKIELRNAEKQLLSKAYHTKNPTTAKALAEKIAHDRKAEIVTTEIPSIQAEIIANHKKAID
jgi:hypothetical protein